MPSYKESLTAAMTALAADPRRVFIGYGLITGRAMGTLRHVPDAQIIETPVAEGLMTSAAIGQSLAGRLPVVYFERGDFLTNAMDAIVNHLFAIRELSRGEFKPAVIIRVTIGNREKPLFTGPVHTQDFSGALDMLVGSASPGVIDTVWNINAEPGCAEDFYRRAAERQAIGISTILFERKDWM